MFKSASPWFFVIAKEMNTLVMILYYSLYIMLWGDVACQGNRVKSTSDIAYMISTTACEVSVISRQLFFFFNCYALVYFAKKEKKS